MARPRRSSVPRGTLAGVGALRRQVFWWRHCSIAGPRVTWSKPRPPLSVERDERAGAGANRQARGQVTRQLKEELRKVIADEHGSAASTPADQKSAAALAADHRRRTETSVSMHRHDPLPLLRAKTLALQPNSRRFISNAPHCRPRPATRTSGRTAHQGTRRHADAQTHGRHRGRGRTAGGRAQDLPRGDRTGVLRRAAALRPRT